MPDAVRSLNATALGICKLVFKTYPTFEINFEVRLEYHKKHDHCSMMNGEPFMTRICLAQIRK